MMATEQKVRAEDQRAGQAHGLDPCASCEARNISVCNAIPDCDLSRLADIAHETIVESGKTFITEGDHADCFYNVTGGTARLYKLLPDGRRQITGFAYAGDFLGLAISTAYAFSAEAIEPVRICRFSRQDLRRLLNDFPEMEKRLLDAASNELVAAQEQMLLLGRKTARERLASFLLRQDRYGQDERHLCLRMTRSDIADYLGLTIETVSRTFTRLRKEGLIDIPEPSTINIQNRAALIQLAEGLTS
jgi:CRP/FNR family transcriptional regulator, anaerobic regulatory protein